MYTLTTFHTTSWFTYPVHRRSFAPLQINTALQIGTIGAYKADTDSIYTSPKKVNGYRKTNTITDYMTNIQCGKNIVGGNIKEMFTVQINRLG